MPLQESQSAPQIIDFGSDAAAPSKAARISYDVPLPGVYSFSRLVPLEVAGDVFTQSVTTAGQSILDVLGASQDQQGTVNDIDAQKLSVLYTAAIPMVSTPLFISSPGVSFAAALRAMQRMEPAADAPAAGDATAPTALDAVTSAAPAPLRARLVQTTNLENLAQEVATQSAQEGVTSIPWVKQGLGRSLQTFAHLKLPTEPLPRIGLIETMQVSSFLGDYGLGRTINTFSLLPGERTTITVNTWRTTTTAVEEATSIFDSADSSSEGRWANELESETGSSQSEQGGWAFSVGLEVGASANVLVASGSVKLDTAFSANHQESRSTFAAASSRASSSHAAQCNNARQQSVDRIQSSTAETGASNTTVRELVNTNLRRVLNFVFRELNQSYEVVTSLRDIKIAVYNGQPGSARTYAFTELADFLSENIAPSKRAEVATALLSAVAHCGEVNGTFVPMLQRGTLTKGLWTWKDVKLADDGSLPGDVLAKGTSWRIKSGSVGPTANKYGVPGVALDKVSTVLKTDTVVIEALLGQADALDPYATALQALDIRQRTAEAERLEIENARLKAGIELAKAVDTADKQEAVEALLAQRPDVSVLGLNHVPDET